MSLIRGSVRRTFRRTFGRSFGRTLRGKSHRKTRVSTADLAASLLPTPRPALVQVPVRSTHRSRRHRNTGYAAGHAGRRMFRVT